MLFMTADGLSYTAFSLPTPSASASPPTIQAFKLQPSLYTPDVVLVTFASGASFMTTLLSNCTLMGTGEIECENQRTSSLSNSACPALTPQAAGNALVAAGT